ncbi:MAG: BrnT family toxin [Endozoicomonadaceae bacterium]|nr:BrnT family toxin [Endozoicomonadaceae bacterium]
MDSLHFEWDKNKNFSNQKKHGVSFEEAKTVFSDELGRIIPDPDYSEDEERFILMGMSSQLKLLTVCHCERGSDTIRIISARKADKHERIQYEGYSHA